VNETWSANPSVEFVSGLFCLQGRVAAITGAGSGLGAAIAIGLARAGATTHLLDINEEGLRATAEHIEQHGSSARTWTCDVTRKSQVDAVEQAIRDQGDEVHILVNSAGSAFRCAAEEFPEEDFDRIIALNLKGTYLPSQAFGRSMLGRGSGSIINIASIGGFIAYPWASAYLASKGGVVQLTRALALEWGPRGVRVNGIGPTLMESALTARTAATSSVTSDFIKSRMLQTRLGQPEQLVGAAIFLGSDASSLVNGHTLMCDDGYLVA
jgi:NAD(P)-dependent dehydrogenase (short-subunit alcohol dehydrogenase family)